MARTSKVCSGPSIVCIDAYTTPLVGAGKGYAVALARFRKSGEEEDVMPHARIGAQAAAARLPEWQVASDRDALTRSFRFADFNSAFGFMTRVAMLAEKLDHHPEWSNIYDRVEVLLTTHDAGGVTDLDVRMASHMDSIFAESRTPFAIVQASASHAG